LEIQKLFFTRISFLIGSTVHQSDLKKVALCFTFLVKEVALSSPDAATASNNQSGS